MLYDYNGELIQEVYVKCIIPIVNHLIGEISTLRRYDNISIYAPANIMREILGILLEEMDELWVDADSENELLYKDGNDVVVTIACDGMVFVEDARYDGVIKSNEDSCLTYFYDGLGKKDLDSLEENAESILVFGFEDDDCEGSNSEDSELATTSNKEQYYINGKEVSKQTWERKQKLINDTIEAFRRDFWDNWLDF